MTTVLKAFVFAALALLSMQAFAINKCTGPDGKVVFQDAACYGKSEQLDVRPASGKSMAPAQDVAPTSLPVAGKPITEAQRIEARVAASQRERKKQELELRIVPGALAAVNEQRVQCDGEIKALQDRKAYAKNNLAGATWEASISSEMTAIATRCNTRNNEVREEHAALLKECRALGGCQ